MSGILKNYEKFGVLKLNMGTSLKNIELSPRIIEENTYSASIKKYNTVWFNMPHGKGIFKTFDSQYGKEIKDIRIINELVCVELAKQLNIPHAKYEEAHLNEDYGLISYNILKGDQKLVSLAKFLSFDRNLDNNLIDIREALDYYQRLGYEVNIPEIMLGLFKLMVFDILTLQSDRNNFNVNFIFDHGTISLAPLFDNEYAYAMELAKFIYENEEDKNITSFISSFSKNAKMLNVQYERPLSEKTIFNNINNLTNLAKSNFQMKEFLTFAIGHFNPQKAFRVLEKRGNVISEEYKSYVTCTTKKIKLLFLKELNKPYAEDTTYIYDEFIK